jgi:Kdo2-lipid IVA lauroyltransferase/acyltransferase
MSKPRSQTIDFAVYLLVRLLVCIIQMLSFHLACKFAGALAWLACRVDKRHRLVALENLEHAFPGRHTPEERDAMVRSVYRHFCMLLIEIIHLPRRFHTGNWKDYLEMENGKAIVECLLSDRPLLIVTGHFGNWEIAGYSLSMLGFGSYAIARPLDNPYLDSYLRTFRERTGQKILAKHGDFAKMQAILAGGGVLATLGDQDAGQRGLFVDFFGRPASTHKAVALLALEHRVPMLVVGAARVGNRFKIIIADPIFPEDYEGRPNAIREMTERFTRDLENMIRRYPEQYFWLHRRWKHQPPKPRRKSAA